MKQKEMCGRCGKGVVQGENCRCLSEPKRTAKVNGMIYPGAFGFEPSPPKVQLRDYDYIVNGGIFLD